MSVPENPSSNNQGFNTRAIHAGQAFEPRTGAVVPPVHFSSTYAQDGIGGLRVVKVLDAAQKSLKAGGAPVSIAPLPQEVA